MGIKSDSSSVGLYYEGILRKLSDEMSKKRKVGEQRTQTRNLYLCTTEKESIQWLTCALEDEYRNERETMICIVDYYKDSMIHLRYLEEIIHRTLKKKTLVAGQKEEVLRIFTIEANEKDSIIRIEDQYNESYSYRLLSRNTKKSLKKIMDYYQEEEKNVEVKSYANSSLV
ncbi:MAG: hypothetical protein JW708_02135 [Vallitaleaceae bacterium]|nr:hypothetical protein [Vallitaleaceae bacterium]